MAMITLKMAVMILNFFKKFIRYGSVFYCILPFWCFSLNWLVNPHYLQKNYTQVRDFENYLFSHKIQDEKDFEGEEDNISQTDLRTYSALIVKDGKIVYEKYAKSYHKDRPQKLLSISKSITNLLIAIAVQEGKISLSDTLCRYFKNYETPFDCAQITVRDLLGWSSGLHWKERFDEYPLQSSVFNMLYNKAGYKDSTAFVLSHPLARKPGKNWLYSSGDSNLLMSVLSKVYRPEEYAVLPWVKLFNEIGIKKAYWDKDQKGVFYGCCSLYLTPRDLARVGQFILQKGWWGGKSFLPSYWVKEYIKSVPPGFLGGPVFIREQFVPSFHWWVNRPARYGNVFVPRVMPAAPADMIIAVGYMGQFLFIVPSMNTVIVRTGDTAGLYLDINAMAGMALNVVRGGSYDHPIRTKPVPFSIGKEYDSPKDYKKNTAFLKVANNFIAKEVCSCVFIERETEKACLENLSIRFETLPSVSVSYEQRAVSVSTFGLFYRGRADYQGKFGCSLRS